MGRQFKLPQHEDVHKKVSCPPFLWCLVVDGLLRKFEEEGIFMHGYGLIVVTGKISSVLEWFKYGEKGTA